MNIRGIDEVQLGWDRILHDTAVEKKRYVIGLKQPITTDIREWISFGDNIIIKEILGDLRKKHRLPSTKNPGDFDRRAMAVWRFIARQISRVSQGIPVKGEGEINEK